MTRPCEINSNLDCHSDRCIPGCAELTDQRRKKQPEGAFDDIIQDLKRIAVEILCTERGHYWVHFPLTKTYKCALCDTKSGRTPETIFARVLTEAEVKELQDAKSTRPT